MDAVPWILTGYLVEDPQRAAAFIRWTARCAPELQTALIPGLIQALRRPESAYESLSSDRNVPKPLREDAIDVLGGMGELAADYLPEIERMQEREEDPALQLRYAVAITSIGGVDEKHVELVRAALENKECYLCFSACEACRNSPLLAEALRGSLVALAEHEDDGVRQKVAWTFLYTEVSGADVTAALETLAVDYSDPVNATCWYALEALAHRGELTDPLPRVLSAAVAMENEDMFDGARVLSAYGEQESFRLIEEKFVSTNPGARDGLLMLLENMPRGSAEDLYRRLLDLSLTDEEREWLMYFLEAAIDRNTPSPRLTDWRLPPPADTPEPEN
jgi:hypothetical protein